eukprot:GHVN01012239.1.p2 GENE.GHVN01012239.1~~GHVN01012239.1.p2  ORF type:complete len:272 (-),score=79.06 GHVN01012239.1:1971-2786(-)
MAKNENELGEVDRKRYARQIEIHRGVVSLLAEESYGHPHGGGTATGTPNDLPAAVAAAMEELSQLGDPPEEVVATCLIQAMQRIEHKAEAGGEAIERGEEGSNVKAEAADDGKSGKSSRQPHTIDKRADDPQNTPSTSPATQTKEREREGKASQKEKATRRSRVSNQDIAATGEAFDRLMAPDFLAKLTSGQVSDSEVSKVAEGLGLACPPCSQSSDSAVSDNEDEDDEEIERLSKAVMEMSELFEKAHGERGGSDDGGREPPGVNGCAQM